MIKILKVIWIMLMVALTLLLETIFCWCKPIKRKLIKDLYTYAKELVKMNREVGSDEMADKMEEIIGKYE